MRYNTPNTPIDSIRDFVTRGGIPVTVTLVSINVATFFIAFFSPHIAGPFLERYFCAFTGADLFPVPHGRAWLAETARVPWTLLTYPLFAGYSVFSAAIGAIFFWLAGGSLERSWGSHRYAGFLGGVTLATSVSLLLGGLIFGQHPPLLFGLYLPLSALIVGFCMLNPDQVIRFYFFPIKAKYVALIVTVLTLVGYGPIFGPFACGGIIAAFLYIRYGRSWADIGSYSGRPRSVPRGPDLRVYPAASKFSTKPRMLDGSERRSLLDLAGRWKDYQERRRLEKLWKNSGFSEPDQKWQDDDRRR